jgi:hypothetical protein
MRLLGVPQRSPVQITKSFIPTKTMNLNLTSFANSHHDILGCSRWIIKALATDSLKESVSLHLGKKREKATKTPHSRSPIFNLLPWVCTVFPNT